MRISTKHMDDRERKLFLGIRKALRQDKEGEFLPQSLREAGFRSIRYQGYCYAAAEAFFHLIRRKGYKMTYLDVGDDFSLHEKFPQTTHWYITTPDGRIIDPTADQYPHGPPYELGRNCGALTKKPSKRARKLMSAVRKIIS